MNQKNMVEGVNVGGSDPEYLTEEKRGIWSWKPKSDNTANGSKSTPGFYNI